MAAFMAGHEFSRHDLAGMCLLKSQETRRQAITIKATPPNSPAKSHFLNGAFTWGTRVSNMSL